MQDILFFSVAEKEKIFVEGKEVQLKAIYTDRKLGEKGKAKFLTGF